MWRLSHVCWEPLPLLGYCIYFYDQTQTLQEPAQMMWQPQPVPEGLGYWLLAQAKALVMIQVIIVILLTFLKNNAPAWE